MKPTKDRQVKSAIGFMRRYAEMGWDEMNGAVYMAHTEHAYIYLYQTKDAWLNARRKYIGASDAPTIEGLTDQWRTARDLFDELTGKTEPTEIVGNELVDMGNEEEPIVRTLFALENPRYTVYDGSRMLWISKTHPWMSCTLDAILVDDETGDISDLEIKCAPWSAKWRDDFVPDNYFVQLLWQLAVTGMRRAFLKARLRFANDTVSATEKHYYIDGDMPDVRAQMDALIDHGLKFKQMVDAKNYFPMGIRI